MATVTVEMSRTEREALDIQQIRILQRMSDIRERFAHRPTPRFASTEAAINACIAGDPEFSDEAYTNVYGILQSIAGPEGLGNFHARARAALFEAVVAFAMPYVLPADRLALSSHETQTLWIEIYSNKRRVRESGGLMFAQKHSPDVAVFQQDFSGNPALTQVVEATLNPRLSYHDVIGKAVRTGYTVLRSRKRGLGLFASDTEMDMTFVVPQEDTVMENIENAISHVPEQHPEKSRTGEVVVGVKNEMAGGEGEEIFIHINYIILPVNYQQLNQAYAKLIYAYRPNKNQPTIAELLREARVSFAHAGMLRRASI